MISGLAKEEWTHALSAELAFWDGWLASDAPEVKENRDRRLKALDRPLPDSFAEGIEDLDGEPIRILDVGAGPLTTLGTLLLGRRVELVPVDPLAESYDRLLARHRINPPVRSVAGEGEALVEQFGTNSFHVAYCANALDHCFAPITVLEQMITVVRPRGLVYVLCMDNVGEMEGYQGLHQWNFTILDGRPTLWRGDRSHDLKRHFAGAAHVEGRFTDEGLVVIELRPFAQ